MDRLIERSGTASPRKPHWALSAWSAAMATQATRAWFTGVLVTLALIAVAISAYRLGQSLQPEATPPTSSSSLRNAAPAQAALLPGGDVGLLATVNAVATPIAPDMSALVAGAADQDATHGAQALLIAAGSVLGGLFVWLLSWHMRRPISVLSEAVARLPDAQEPIRVAITATGEMGQLQRDFNEASAALAESQQALRTQVQQATLELEAKNRALEAANLARARFLAAASHDLRQPLYALTLFSSALAADEVDPKRAKRIGHLQDCVSSLDHLFNELLDLSRLEAGAMHPTPCEFALDGLFQEVSRNFRMAAEERGVRLVVRKTDLWVRTDRVMLARIVNNLVSNAIRYTHSGGALVGARVREGRVRIEVWDTGAGIAPEHRERIFEEFYQAHGHSAPTGERRGLGLGLATVQRLCDLLELPITLASRPALGSVFSVTVPRTEAIDLRLSHCAKSTPQDMSGLRVLVVDDESSILEGIDALMGSWGCQVGTAEDGEQAIRIARSWPTPPDIVITDLQLGDGRNGLDVLNALSAHYHAAGKPGFARLLVTGETKAERLHEIHAARIPVLFKPVSPEQLRKSMVAAITARTLH